MADLDRVLSQWARLGAMFNVHPAQRTPDIEPLLVDTMSVLPCFARLCGMTVSWLVRYYQLVCRHRLAVLASEIRDPRQSASLGYVLTEAKQQARVDHFNLAIHACRPLPEPQPLFEAYLRNPAMTALAEQQADPISRQWGLWAPPERLYQDAVRPVEWVMCRNPSLKSRADFGGKLTATILVVLEKTPDAGRNESVLSRACHATRSSVRDALARLEFSQRIRRQRMGNSARILLC